MTSLRRILRSGVFALSPARRCAGTRAAALLAAFATASAAVSATAHAQGLGAAPPSSQSTTLPLTNTASRFRPRAPTPQKLSPLADTVAALLTFQPVGEPWFVAASRGKRLVLDIGRVDTDLKKDPARKAAFLEAVPSRTTVPLGTRFVLRGAWGTETAEVAGFDAWNGRIIAILTVSALADSLARTKASLVASAYRGSGDAGAPAGPLPGAPAGPVPGTPAGRPSVTPAAPVTAPPTDTLAPLPCVVDSLVKPSKLFTARLTAVKDSLKRIVQSGVPRMTVFELTKHPKPPTWKLSQVAGCFDGPRMAVAVSLRGTNYEWVLERVALVGLDGSVTAAKLSDFRFKGHELIGAFDADGDGVVDLVTRAVAEASGGTTILRYDPKARRFERLVAGFQWEQR